MRKSVYCLLSNLPFISAISGDRINELNIYRALSVNYDVYYNNRKLNFNDTINFGTNPRDTVSPPNRKYDFYYVRNNPLLFGKLPHPKLYFCVPNHQQCFKQADGIVVTTDTWKESLINNPSIFGSIYKRGDYFPPILVFNQITHPEDLRNHKKTLAYRKKYTCDFLIGYFGRITPTNNPSNIFKTIGDIGHKNPDKKIKVIVSGRIKTGLRLKGHLGFINPGELKYLVSACDLTLYNETAQGNFSGSLKTMLSMSHGVPILMKHHKQRILELGENYPLYIKTNDDLTDKLQWLLNNPDESKKIGNYLLNRSIYYNLENSAIRYKEQIDKII